MHHQETVEKSEPADGCEIAFGIVGKVLAQKGKERYLRRPGKDDRVAVRGGACRSLRADNAARSRAVVDDDRLTERL